MLVGNDSVQSSCIHVRYIWHCRVTKTNNQDDEKERRKILPNAASDFIGNGHCDEHVMHTAHGRRIVPLDVEILNKIIKVSTDLIKPTSYLIKQQKIIIASCVSPKICCPKMI